MVEPLKETENLFSEITEKGLEMLISSVPLNQIKLKC